MIFPVDTNRLWGSYGVAFCWKFPVGVSVDRKLRQFLLLQHTNSYRHINVWFTKDSQFTNTRRSIKKSFLIIPQLHCKNQTKGKQFLVEKHDWRSRNSNRYGSNKPKKQLSAFWVQNHTALFVLRDRFGVQSRCNCFGVFFPGFLLFKMAKAKRPMSVVSDRDLQVTTQWWKIT